MIAQVFLSDFESKAMKLRSVSTFLRFLLLTAKTLEIWRNVLVQKGSFSKANFKHLILNIQFQKSNYTDFSTFHWTFTLRVYISLKSYTFRKMSNNQRTALPLLKHSSKNDLMITPIFLTVFEIQALKDRLLTTFWYFFLVLKS